MEEDVIYSDSWDDHFRYLYKKECLRCKKIFYCPKHVINSAKYCSRSCSSLNRRSTTKYNCSWCKKEFIRRPSAKKNSKSKLYFCNRICKESAQHLDGIKEIHPSHYHSELVYRRRALKEYGEECNRCGYYEHVVMLDVHHKDSNRENNNIDNLEVLCVWCHALETRKNWALSDKRNTYPLQG